MKNIIFLPSSQKSFGTVAILVVGFLFCTNTVTAQQDHQYTLFAYNKLQLNPAYAGERGVPSLTGIYRNQWVGFQGAPESALLSFNTPFFNPRVGMGLTVSGQKAALQRDVHAALAYSYDLINSDGIALRMGIQGSMRALSVDFSESDPLTPIGQDQSLNGMARSDAYGNLGSGLYLNYKNKFFAGFSVPQIYTNTIGTNSNVLLTAKEYRHFYGTFGTSIPLSSTISMQPSVLLKYVKNVPFDADINISMNIRDKITPGISYRLGGDGFGESVSLTCFFLTTKQLGIGAAYDFTLSNVRSFHSGSFDLMVRYDLKPVGGKNTDREMTNPRFFF